MNTNDLYLEYARVIQMCEGTELEDTPWVCVKARYKSIFINHPEFDGAPSEYEFAVAILEGKPIFVGSILYDKLDENIFPQEIAVRGIDEHGALLIGSRYKWSSWKENASWTPPTKPKRTFTLSGGGQISGYKSGDLPCPVDSGISKHAACTLEIGEYFFGFASVDDMCIVENAIVNLLTEARDKP